MHMFKIYTDPIQQWKQHSNVGHSESLYSLPLQHSQHNIFFISHTLIKIFYILAQHRVIESASEMKMACHGQSSLALRCDVTILGKSR